MQTILRLFKESRMPSTLARGCPCRLTRAMRRYSFTLIWAEPSSGNEGNPPGRQMLNKTYRQKLTQNNAHCLLASTGAMRNRDATGLFRRGRINGTTVQAPRSLFGVEHTSEKPQRAPVTVTSGGHPGSSRSNAISRFLSAASRSQKYCENSRGAAPATGETHQLLVAHHFVEVLARGEGDCDRPHRERQTPTPNVPM